MKFGVAIRPCEASGALRHRPSACGRRLALHTGSKEAASQAPQPCSGTGVRDAGLQHVGLATLHWVTHLGLSSSLLAGLGQQELQSESALLGMPNLRLAPAFLSKGPRIPRDEIVVSVRLSISCNPLYVIAEII